MVKTSTEPAQSTLLSSLARLNKSVPLPRTTSQSNSRTHKDSNNLYSSSSRCNSSNRIQFNSIVNTSKAIKFTLRSWAATGMGTIMSLQWSLSIERTCHRSIIKLKTLLGLIRMEDHSPKEQLEVLPEVSRTTVEFLWPFRSMEVNNNSRMDPKVMIPTRISS